jgi:predicted dinucleotide-binding enzyme
MDETIAANAKILDGKIVIDAANKISAAIAHSLSTFQAQTPKARYVRAFNNYGWGNFEDPLFDNVPADLFYCGPEGDARSAIERLIGDVGLNPVYLGGPEQANAVDGVLRLWFALTSQLKTRQIAFKVLRR